ncbi:MAG: aminotransferase class V-fold PLP-dependent enzyme [Nitrososphaerales archaeon]
MGIYEELGVKTIISACGPKTTLSGTRMPMRAAQAMAEASQSFVDMDQLQAKASEVIAQATGAEAGLVTSGAAAALTLGTAACITGLDIVKMQKLPDASQLKNEVIIPRHHRNVFDHSIRAAGVKLVEVGLFGRSIGVGVRGVEDWEIESAINERTAAIAFFNKPQVVPSLESVIKIGKRNGVPVLVDAAGGVPPTIRKLIEMGADLVAASGGKMMRGPQATGILCGRKDLIMAAALQMLDMDTRFETWNPPPQFIDKSKLPGIPQHGFGRGFKAGKEEIVALIVAIKTYGTTDHEAETADYERRMKRLVELLSKVEGVKPGYIPVSPVRSLPGVEVRFLNARSLQDMVEIVARLKSSDPPVYLYERELEEMTLSVNPFNLTDSDVETIARSVAKVVEEVPLPLPESAGPR